LTVLYIRVKDYLSTTNVQLGATYRIGKQSTQKFDAGIKAASEYINASPDEIGTSVAFDKSFTCPVNPLINSSHIVLGASTTQLFRNLSLSLLPNLPPSSELIISALDHEANIASWVTLASTLHLTLKWWKPASSTNPHLEKSTLLPLLTSNTRLVTCTHTSNILGSITSLRSIADLVHTIPGALLCVDGVAYAPHRAIDVKALDIDFYAFSWYKVYGPHIAQLYAKRSAQDSGAMASLGHYFKGGWTLEEKLGLAGASYELAQSLPVVVKYLEGQGWKGVVAHEVRLQEVLLAYLRSKPEMFTIWGEPMADAGSRVPVVSFTVKGRRSRELVESMEGRTEFGFRWGHFYSKRLVEGVLGLGEDGVVWVSMVHYNTVEEVERFVKALNEEVYNH